MSTAPQPFPPSTDAMVPFEPPRSQSLGGREPATRRQAAEIIESVLSGSEPDQADIREQLRGCLAAHPGRPEAAVLEGRILVTAFQPIRDLATGIVVGAGALTRFLSKGGDSAEDWFVDAKRTQLGGDLEFAALESALAAARELPAHLYAGLKLSPATCLDPLLPVLLEETALEPERMVLELTDAMTREQTAPLVAALAPLRRKGLRLAIDHAGSFFTSIRHIRHVRPEIIKLDRNLIAGIDTDTNLGMTAGQGYLLGRPTTRTADWKAWGTWDPPGNPLLTSSDRIHDSGRL